MFSEGAHMQMHGAERGIDGPLSDLNEHVGYRDP